MATQLQIRRGTSAQIAAFTGAEGEIVVNTTNDSVHVNDGSTAGGFELARADLNNVSDTSLNAALTGNTVSALTITTLTLGSTAITATGTELNYVDGVTSAIQTQIDTKAPLASPTFTGTVTADGGTIVSTGSDAFSSKAVGGYAIQAYQDATSSGHTALDLRSDATTDTRYLIRGYNDAAGTPTEVFSVGADGSAFLNSNLGIGTSSPSEPLTVLSAQDYQITAAYNAANSTSYGYYGIKNNNTGNPFYFNVGGAERMRISGGNVLVGKTTTAFGTVGIRLEGPNGKIEATRSNNIVMDLNRLSGDGAIANFSKDGTTVGSISVNDDKIIFGTANAAIAIDQSSNILFPYNPATPGARDAAIDLGYASGRFKDLHLSGEAKVTSTGVDGVYAPILRGVYSGNSNETNTIETTVSSSAAGSGFKFNVSNGGGSSGQTEGLRITRDGLYAPVGIKLGGTGSANKLDDYEEGTWTAVDQNGNAYTPNVQASYTKIGRLVYFNFDISSTAVTTGPFVYGLPFPSLAATVSGNWSVYTGYSTSNADITGHINASSSKISVYVGSTTHTINGRWMGAGSYYAA